MPNPTRDHGTSVTPLAFDVQARISEIDQVALRKFRLDRVRAELRKRDYAGVLLADPLNIRYATGTRNMQVWTMRVPGRYAFIATDGPVVMFEFNACKHLDQGLGKLCAGEYASRIFG